MTPKCWSGPDWAFLQPTELFLGSGEEGTLYLYLSPTFGTSRQTYTVSVRASSANSQANLDVSVVVPENISEVTVSEPEVPGEPEEPTNITINETHPEVPSSGNDSSLPVTGGAVEERPFWKTAAVAIIALIIVAILVLRFVLLLKK